jgi:hypothetical protein
MLLALDLKFNTITFHSGTIFELLFFLKNLFIKFLSFDSNLFILIELKTHGNFYELGG